MVFIRSLLQSVFSKTMFDHLNDKQKYHAISLNQSLNGAGTIEFRNVRPYQQGDQVDLIAKAIVARRDYLIKNPGIELMENFSASLSEQEKFDVFIKYIKQIGLDELKYFPLLPKETIQFALKRLTPTQQAQYLVDYAKYTAFNDIDRHSALLENLKSLDSAEAQKHALYILLEKTNETDSFKPFTDNAKDLLDQLAIEPEEFLRNNKAQYSLYAPKVPFDCAEALNIILN